MGEYRVQGWIYVPKYSPLFSQLIPSFLGVQVNQGWTDLVFHPQDRSWWLANLLTNRSAFKLGHFWEDLISWWEKCQKIWPSLTDFVIFVFVFYSACLFDQYYICIFETLEWPIYWPLYILPWFSAVQCSTWGWGSLGSPLPPGLHKLETLELLCSLMDLLFNEAFRLSILLPDLTCESLVMAWLIIFSEKYNMYIFWLLFVFSTNLLCWRTVYADF